MMAVERGCISVATISATSSARLIFSHDDDERGDISPLRDFHSRAAATAARSVR